MVVFAGLAVAKGVALHAMHLSKHNTVGGWILTQNLGLDMGQEKKQPHLVSKLALAQAGADKGRGYD
jgi:hypothetical protein